MVSHERKSKFIFGYFSAGNIIFGRGLELFVRYYTASVWLEPSQVCWHRIGVPRFCHDLRPRTGQYLCRRVAVVPQKFLK